MNGRVCREGYVFKHQYGKKRPNRIDNYALPAQNTSQFRFWLDTSEHRHNHSRSRHNNQRAEQQGHLPLKTHQKMCCCSDTGPGDQGANRHKMSHHATMVLDLFEVQC